MVASQNRDPVSDQSTTTLRISHWTKETQTQTHISHKSSSTSLSTTTNNMEIQEQQGMEWEPTTMAVVGPETQNSTFVWNDTKNNPNAVTTVRRRRRRSHKEDGRDRDVTEAERRMIIESTLPYDVLLVGTSSSLKTLVRGNVAYYEQIRQYRKMVDRPRSYDGRHDGNELVRSMVQAVMEYIWSNHGRFLSYDSQQGILSILPTSRTKQYIQQDLMDYNQAMKGQDAASRRMPRRQRQRLHFRSLSSSLPKHKKEAVVKTKRTRGRHRRRHDHHDHSVSSTLPSTTAINNVLQPPRTMSFGQTRDGTMYGDV
jgi:hypothetical protein